MGCRAAPSGRCARRLARRPPGRSPAATPGVRGGSWTQPSTAQALLGAAGSGTPPAGARPPAGWSGPSRGSGWKRRLRPPVLVWQGCSGDSAGVCATSSAHHRHRAGTRSCREPRWRAHSGRNLADQAFPAAQTTPQPPGLTLMALTTPQRSGRDHLPGVGSRGLRWQAIRSCRRSLHGAIWVIRQRQGLNIAEPALIEQRRAALA